MNKREKRRLQLLLDAEKTNYETAKAMPTPNREIDKGDLLSRSWGRITLLSDLLGVPHPKQSLESQKSETEK